MKTKNIILVVLFRPDFSCKFGKVIFFDNFLSNLSSMQAQIIQEKQLVEKDKIKMFTFGLKVALLQK